MGVVLIVFIFVTIMAISGQYFETKQKKMKIEAALRQQEMENGYAPGTYSRVYTSKSEYRKFEKEQKKSRKRGVDPAMNDRARERSEREALEKGIEDLQRRIDDIDLIIRTKNGKKDQGERNGN
ncbi:MAG: hypothetical protein SPJ34_06075 [Candidatus Ornithospirochaeta sp.]|nr:hypothetical protein [Candidatus Ornithospirochaeta sp.]